MQNKLNWRVACLSLGVLSLVLLGACTLNQSPPAAGETAAASPTSLVTETTLPTMELTATFTATAFELPTASATATQAATATELPTETATALPSSTATLESSPQPSLSATYDFPDASILMQANCRYGPGTAYLYSHGLYAGDKAEVHGRNYSGSWLWIKPENLNRHCWAAASVMEVTGDVMVLQTVQTVLPKSVLYGPPQNIQAVRNGDKVRVTWDRVNMTLDDDRGYLIEASLCQNGWPVWVAVQTYDNWYEFTDEDGCTADSWALLYTVEKHGYVDPVKVPWP